MIEAPVLPLTASARRQQILARLRTIAAALLDIDAADVDVDRNFLELGADSLTLLDASRAIQDTFGVTLSMRLLLEEISNFSNLAAYIEQALPASAEPGGGVRTAAPAEQPADAPSPAREPEPPTNACVAPAAEQPQVRIEQLPVPPPGPPLALPQQPAPVIAAPALVSVESPRVVYASAPGAADAAGSTVVERVIAQQVQFLSQQLEQQRQILGHQLSLVTGIAVGAPNPVGSVPAPCASVAPQQTEPPPRPAAAVADVPAPVPATPPAAAPRAPVPVENTGAEPFIPYRPITPGSMAGMSPRQQAHLEALTVRYVTRTARSKEYAERYRVVFAENRASTGFQMATKEMLYPIVAERSKGSRFWDLDGNEYIDLAMGFGVFLFGHSPEFIQQALARQLEKGFQIGPQSQLAGSVAERICALTRMERVAFCNTGTEAVMVALRLARTATGRSKIAMFSGAFHGSNDVTLMRSRKANGDDRAVPIAPGIPRSVADDVLVVDYDKSQSLDVIRAHGPELAAVLVEPVQSRRPELQPAEFLRNLRRIATDTGTALIFDEIITGFRAHPRGVQGLFGVQADLALYGKVLAGGLPLGIVAGSARFMNCYDGGPWHYGDTSYPRALTSFFAGTFSKHPLTMATVSAVLDELEHEGPALQERLTRKTAYLAETLNQFFVAEELPIRVNHFSSLFRFSFNGNLDLFFSHLVEKGIYTWEGRNCFLSTAHTDDDLERIICAVKESALELRAAGFLPAATPRAAPVTVSRVAAASEQMSATASAPAATVSRRPDTKSVAFSLYYFGEYPAEFYDGKYDLLFEGARFADAHGFDAVWFPERHFHEFGGLSPNPSILAAALARETSRIHLRAGSVVLPFHNPIRMAEEWSMVDNLSKGRVGVSMASGWHWQDFVFAPDAYGKHRELMFQQIETVQRLWRGEVLEAPGGGGRPAKVKLVPMPMQRELPLWITIVSNPDTYARAGAIGAGILTNLMEQTSDDLARNLEIYRGARQQHGFDPETGTVTLLMHTYMGDDLEAVRRKAEAPFCAYLKCFLGIARSWIKGQGLAVNLEGLSEADLDYLLSTSYKQYVHSTALIGTPSTCAPIVDRLASIGVTEIACFVDFGVDHESSVQSFKHVYALKQMFDQRARLEAAVPSALRAPAAITVRDDPAPAANSNPAPPAPAAERDAAEVKPIRTFPLTEGQQGFWLFSQLSTEANSASTESMVLRLKGPFQFEAMRSAMQQVVDRHEALRTTIDAGGERQYVWPTRPIDVAVLDFSDRPAADCEAAVFQWLTEQKEPAFDLVRGPLWRCYVLNIDDEDHVLVLTIHHLVVDGWSFTVIGQELAVLYPAACRGERVDLPAAMQYHEYVEWEERERTTPARAASEAYWKHQYADGVPVVDLPSDRPRPGVATYRGAREHRRVDDDLYAALKTVGNRYGSTLFMTMFAAFTVFLKRVTGQADLVVGSPSVRRSLPGSEGIVGFTLNNLAIRIKLQDDLTFPEHLARVKKVLFDSYEHGDCPITVTSRNLNLGRDPSRPVFSTVQFNLNPRISIRKMGDLSVDLVPRPLSFTPFDLFLDAMEINGELRLDFLYNTGLLDPATMQRWMDNLIVLLRSIAQAPERPVSSLELLSARERQLLDEWSRTESASPRHCCVHELVEEQAERTPDDVAVTVGSHRLTYRELNRRANQVAHRVRELGAGPDALVGICLDRSPDLIAAVLGVLKAGAAYLPLDPEYPAERLAFMVQDAGARVLLTGSLLQERLPVHGATVVCLDDDLALDATSAETPPRANAPQDLAYVLYTSGSTGKPKGVEICHQAVVNVLMSMLRRPGLTREDRLLAVTSLSFDISVVEMLLPLITGAEVVMVGREVAADGIALLNALVESRATVMQATPATWRLLLEAGWKPDWRGRDRFTVITGGEALSRELADRLLERASTVWNGYGPTETTIYSTGEAIDAVAGRVAIGRPIDNTRVYVVDHLLQPVPIGVPGELLIGGTGLARGYLARPELTAERFIPDPFGGETGARLYRTGDLVRFRADGRTEFLNRIDQQVKIRGLRVELGEIEAVLTGHPAVREAVVVPRDYGPNDKQLDAYLVAQPGRAAPSEELRAFAKRSLPDYMVPSTYVFLDRLPLTPNGKVDRRALPDVRGDRGEQPRPFVAPATPMEQVIATMFSDVLGIKSIGIHENFFDLGGHSLQGTQVIARVRELFAVDVSLTSLFEAPTIATLAALVGERQRETRQAGEVQPGPQPSIPARVPGEPPPLSYAQQRLWFLNQLEPTSPAYHLANALRLEGPLNVDALERSLREIVGRHESLRTRFVSHEGQPAQIVSRDSPIALARRDLRHLRDAEQNAAVQELAAEETRRPFDLVQGPLLRTALLQLDEQVHVLTLTVHHIVSDGWSVSVFARELAALYDSFSTGAPSRLPPLPIQYADYARWQREWLQGEVLTTQLDYWKRQLAGSPAVLELPTDRPRPGVKQYRGAYHPFAVPRDLADRLHAIGRQADATPFMVLLAAFQTLLYRHTGQDDIAVGSPIANRGRTETENLIGLFINTLVLRTHLDGNPTFRELLGRVRQTALDAYLRQDVPFELVVDAIQPERSLSHSPLFQVMFVLQNNPPAAMKLSGLTISQVDIERVTSKFDLTLSMEEGPGGFTAGFQYDTDLFDAATIGRMADRFVTLLRSLAANPDQRIATLPIVNDRELDLISEWNDTGVKYPPALVHELFEAQVERSPHAIAIVHGDGQLEYEELNRRANQLAHHLRSLGVGPETAVGLYVERSLETIVGILGTLKAGGAYVPIDPTSPPARVAFMLEDARIGVLLAHRKLAADLPARSVKILFLDGEPDFYTGGQDTNPAVAIDPSNLAYLIYTSGSTGRPKAVAVEHRQLTNYVRGVTERLGLPADGSYATVSTFAADLGHTMVFPGLANGATLHVIPADTAGDPAAFAAHVRSHHIDCLKIVPTHMAMLLSGAPSAGILPLRKLVLGGEESQTAWVEELLPCADACEIFNHYGPTETTVGVLTYAVERGRMPRTETLPLGRPLPNTQVYILDPRLEPAPLGVPGEIYIGGAGVARGYLDRPDLTAERFLPNPFSGAAGDRLYRTGDRGRFLADGSVEFLGRTDQQVKLRGYRVELAEIEAILLAHPSAEQAVVQAWYAQDSGRATRLAAYIVPAAGAPPSVDLLRQFLKDKLPDYMVPGSFVFLDALPLTPNGKLDRRALPEPDRDRPRVEETFVPPGSPLEHVLAGIWAEVLEVDAVGIHDNFFELGGHSLMATQVMARVFKVFEVEVPLRRLFETPTIAGLRDALLQLPGETEQILETAQLLLKLGDVPDDELESQLAEKLAGA